MSAFDDYLATFDGDPGYLDWATFGPISPTVRAEVFADADLLGSGRPSSRVLIAERLDEARETAAELLAVDAETVTLQPSSSHGLMHALYGLTGVVIAGSRRSRRRRANASRPFYPDSPASTAGFPSTSGLHRRHPPAPSS